MRAIDKEFSVKFLFGKYLFQCPENVIFFGFHLKLGNFEEV